MIFQKGNTIDNRYTVVFPHKEGAYAETYRVKDMTGKLRFLKLIYYSKLHASQFDKDGCIIELEVAKLLNHKNICNFVDSGRFLYNGQQFAYFVTEFVSGETLDKRIVREGKLGVYEIKKVLISLLSALRYLHTLPTPIIHNEVTTQNIMLDLSGKLEDLKLIDFGYARFLNQDPVRPNLKQFNPFYMASERFNGVSCVQSDLFSVGVIMYQLLYESLPWFFDTSGMTSQQIIDKLQVERENPLRIPDINIFELDEQFINIIYKATQNNVDDRFQSAQEMIDAIEGKIKVEIPTKVKTAASSSKKINVKNGNGFADVAGMKELKEQLQWDVIDLIQHPEEATELGISIPNGLLFYGPPGCGKSFFAEKFAEEAGFNYLYIKCSDIASPYIHGGQEKIAAIFNQARENAPTILFFDEIDAMLKDRSKHNNVSESGEVNEFLAQLNNCGKDNVIVIGATNKPMEIDEAALRSGRLELKYYIPLPDAEVRKQIFIINITKRKHDFGIDYDRLSQLTEKYTSSDIVLIIDNAARLSRRVGVGKITMALLEQVINQSNPSLTDEQIKKHEDIRDIFTGVKKEQPRRKIGFN